MILDEILNKIPNFLAAKSPSKEEIEDILSKALQLKGLSLEECAKILNIKDSEDWYNVFQISLKVKEKIFGSRIALFAPLYVTNVCRNECIYCGFRRSNKLLQRKTLSDQEILEEIRILRSMGHRRICLVYGDNPKFKIEDIIRHIQLCFDSQMYEVCINLEPPSKENFLKLKECGLPIYYRVFQETYHLPTYQEVHKQGPKANYKWRVEVFDRAIQAGITNIGLGVLFGLYNYKFEVLSLIAHVYYLLNEYGVKIKSISVPRLRPSPNTPYSSSPPYPVSEEELKKIIAVLRLSIPWAEIIITTRESPQFRISSCNIGVSEMSAGSSTSPGGYSKRENKDWIKNTEQFELQNHTTVEDVILNLCSNGYIPSFWSLCSLNINTISPPSEIDHEGLKYFYMLNAIITFKEYLSTKEFSLFDLQEVERIIEKAYKEIKECPIYHIMEK
jgi:2-iminoacetate synthase